MTAYQPPPDQATITGRLRAAGCVFAEDEAQLLIAASTTAAELDAMVERRIAGSPLEQILGWAEFCGRRVAVDRGVFVPRRRTELLVRESLQLIGSGSVVVELCCGTGAVSAAIIASADRLELYACDIEPTAVQCSRRNIGGAGHVLQGDLYEPLPPNLRGRVDVLIANAPYVPTDAIGLMPPEAREHEPLIAHDGGPDGLDLARRVVAGAPSWLAPGGHLLMETSERQAPALLEIFAENELTGHVVNDEDIDGTAVHGQRRGFSAP